VSRRANQSCTRKTQQYRSIVESTNASVVELNTYFGTSRHAFWRRNGRFNRWRWGSGNHIICKSLKRQWWSQLRRRRSCNWWWAKTQKEKESEEKNSQEKMRLCLPCTTIESSIGKYRRSHHTRVRTSLARGDGRINWMHMLWVISAIAVDVIYIWSIIWGRKHKLNGKYGCWR